jgi:hypothetical protein
VLFEQVQQDANCETHTPSSHTLVALQGSYFAWKASAIGKNMVNAKTFLEKRFSEELELEDAIHTAILTLKVLIFPFDHDPRCLAMAPSLPLECVYVALTLGDVMASPIAGRIRGTDDGDQHRDWNCGQGRWLPSA